MDAPAHRLILNEEYGVIIETIMEGQSHLETARRLNEASVVDAHLGEALDELRWAQNLLGHARYLPAWDGRVERRRCLKVENGAYHRRDEARA